MYDLGPCWVMSSQDVSEKPIDKPVILLYPQSPHLNVFGWGDHVSTVDCLQALEEVDLVDKSVVDIGTGTGILAIFAAKLGAKVTAFESKPNISEYTQSNFDLNEVNIELKGTWPDDWDGESFDFVVANLGDNGPDVLTAGKVIGNGNS